MERNMTEVTRKSAFQCVINKVNVIWNEQWETTAKEVIRSNYMFEAGEYFLAEDRIKL
jgi:hypothetical protein